MNIWTDYTEAIGKALKMLDRLRKLKGQIEKAGDLITFNEDDLGICLVGLCCREWKTRGKVSQVF
jgi:hypothetical protein